MLPLPATAIFSLKKKKNQAAKQTTNEQFFCLKTQNI
jgi:hypothetical protein